MFPGRRPPLPPGSRRRNRCRPLEARSQTRLASLAEPLPDKPPAPVRPRTRRRLASLQCQIHLLDYFQLPWVGSLRIAWRVPRRPLEFQDPGVGLESKIMGGANRRPDQRPGNGRQSFSGQMPGMPSAQGPATTPAPAGMAAPGISPPPAPAVMSGQRMGAPAAPRPPMPQMPGPNVWNSANANVSAGAIAL
jgi:hypothetical protein